KRKWLEELPQKYKLDSNDKIEALVNGDATNKVYFGPRQIGKTHMLLLDLVYYMKHNPDKRVSLISPNHMQTTINADRLIEIIRDIMPGEIEGITRNPSRISLKNGCQVVFQYDSINMRGHKFDAVFLDNLDYVSDEVFERAYMCTDFNLEAVFIANQTSVQEISRAMTILRRNE
ncbi:MAG: terminase large subunit domain-containing protein, partial [Paraclostridium sp.]